MITREKVRDALGGGTLGGLVADLLLTGGDVILAIVTFAFDSIEVWLALASQVVRLSDRVEAIPPGAADKLLAGVASLFVLITVVRLGRRAWSRVTKADK